MMHIPVLLRETIESLAPTPGDRVLDATLGLGGHAYDFLTCVGSKGYLVGLDADEMNLLEATKNLKKFKNAIFLHANFGSLPEALPNNRRVYDVILADLGLSSPHIDDPERGFTFRSQAPLDMRFDQSIGESASRVLQASDPITLRKVFKEYGELPRFGSLVDAIVRRRSSEHRVHTSKDLCDVVTEVYGYKAPKFFPQVFQALRIYVNRELDMLTTFLSVALTLLAPGGRLGVISYHSLEDRIVKNFFRDATSPVKDPLTGSTLHVPEFALISKKPIKPSDDEVHKNPRSRSAIFRAIRKRM